MSRTESLLMRLANPQFDSEVARQAGSVAEVRDALATLVASGRLIARLSTRFGRTRRVWSLPERNDP